MGIVEMEVTTLHAAFSQSNVLTKTPHTRLCVDERLLNDPFCPAQVSARAACLLRCSKRKDSSAQMQENLENVRAYVWIKTLRPRVKKGFCLNLHFPHQFGRTKNLVILSR